MCIKSHQCKKNGRKDLVNALHKVIEPSLKPVVDTAVQGLHDTSLDRAQILFQFLLTSYIAAISERENVLFVKRSTRYSSLFHNCLIKAVSFNPDKTAERRNLEESSTLLTEASQCFLLVQQTIAHDLGLFHCSSCTALLNDECLCFCWYLCSPQIGAIEWTRPKYFKIFEKLSRFVPVKSE